MKPYEFEQFVCDHYRQEGYRTQVTSATGDYGVGQLIHLITPLRYRLRS